jgi:hypothetical protein
MNTLTRLWARWTSHAPASRPTDALDMFGSEHTRSGAGPNTAANTVAAKAGRHNLTLLLILFILAAAAGGYAVWKWRPLALEAASASLTIESSPAGAQVLSSEGEKGITPLTLSVTPGVHEFEVFHQGRRKPLTITARAGAAVVHHVEFDAPAASVVARKSGLDIVTEPSKLPVLVNGVSRGLSPVTLRDLDPGRHRVLVAGTAGVIERQVELAPGETASVIISSGAPINAPSGGWLTVAAPFPLQILEGKDVVGTSQASKIMLPAGRHELVLSNDSLGFSEKRVVQVAAGKTASVKIDHPQAPLSINALPWAEVWIDGTRIGETPIGNHLVGIGAREVVFRHPQYGERRQTVIVSLSSPARVSVDMKNQ